MNPETTKMTFTVDYETFEMFQRAMLVSKLDGDVLLKKMLENARIDILLTSNDITVETVVQGRVNSTSTELLSAMDQIVVDLEYAKPLDKSEKARIYAMCRSDIQKAASLFDRHVVRGES